MLYGFVLVIHLLVCFILIGIVLIQGGRGGIGETLGGSGSQSLFGGGVNTFIAKVTAVCGGVFMVTCLVLAMLSTARGRSVIEQVPTHLPGILPGSEGPGLPSSEPSLPFETEAPQSTPAASTHVDHAPASEAPPPITPPTSKEESK